MIWRLLWEVHCRLEVADSDSHCFQTYCCCSNYRGGDRHYFLLLRLLLLRCRCCLFSKFHCVNYPGSAVTIAACQRYRRTWPSPAQEIFCREVRGSSWICPPPILHGCCLSVSLSHLGRRQEACRRMKTHPIMLFRPAQFVRRYRKV